MCPASRRAAMVTAAVMPEPPAAQRNKTVGRGGVDKRRRMRRRGEVRRPLPNAVAGVACASGPCLSVIRRQAGVASRWKAKAGGEERGPPSKAAMQVQEPLSMRQKACVMTHHAWHGSALARSLAWTHK